MSQISKFQIIDGGVESYFERNGDSNYTNKHGNGKFLQYILDEQLDDPELPIEDELGDHSDPNDCAYTWFYNNSETKFPIPTNMQIPNEKMELFIFYILQYIFKYNNPPTDGYIETDILPKVNGKVISCDSMLSQSDSYVIKSCVTKTNKYKPNINYESKEGSISDCESIEGYDTNNINNISNISIKRISKKIFKPEYASRAHLNIYTGKELIKNLLCNINESFDNELNLYYYTDISAALQMNDKQIYIYEIIKDNNNKFIFGIINYDLHCKNTNMNLYGIIIPNNNNKKQQNKWLWKLDSFINANHIMYLYGVYINELPKSSRQMIRFKSELNQNLIIEEKIISETDWFKITQIKSLKRNISIPKVSITLTKELWISECLNSLRNNNFPLIPVVLNKNNNHWIEWLKIIYIKSQNISIGISFKYNLNINKLSVESICLDSGDIYNKHRLIGINNIKYKKQLNNFKISINEIIFSDNNQNIIDKKMIVLKQQITSQQNSIVKLKESIHKINNNDKKYNNNNKNNNIQSVTIQNEIKQIINNNKYKINMKYEQDFVSQIVDDVIKKYNVCIFKTNPIGIRQNIYIAKEFVRLWINNIQNKFENVEEMYYYFDVMTCIQMIQKESKKYIINNNYNENEEFIAVIINYELYDFNGNLLYGIINKQFDNKYKYKLIALMNENEIINNFGIYSHDLPAKSRENKDFINKLLLKRKICKQDLNAIKWSNLKIYKTQSINNNNDLINNKSITITRNVMNEYINISLERINNNNNLIPILIIDKYNNLYNIEWILIVNIIHKNCPIGISFKYNNSNSKYLYEATSIYLNKNEIEMKHKLIGLKNNYCKNIPYFNIKRLKFKSNKDTIIDDDDHIVNNTSVNINTEKVKYEQLIENEKIKIKQLQQQLSQIQNQQQQAVYIQQQFQNQQQLFNLNKMQSQYQYPMYNNNNFNVNVNNMNQQWISNGGY